MIIGLKRNDLWFSKLFLKLPFGFAIRIEGKNITLKTDSSDEDVKNKFNVAFYLVRKTCSPIFYFIKFSKVN